MNLRQGLRVLTSVVLALICAFGALLFNFYILDPLFIPDYCAYHNGKAEETLLLNIFYEMNAGTGHHPDPNLFNMLLTLAVGAFCGWKLNGVLFYRPAKIAA